MNQQVTSWVLKRQRTRNLIANIYWIMEKAREFQKNIYFFVDYVKDFHSLDQNKLWKILQEIGIPEHLTCLLRNLYNPGADGRSPRVRSNILLISFLFLKITMKDFLEYR